jgi:glycerophosphoryl diester phosphodiesterase
MRTKKRNLKRRLLWAASLLLVVAGIFAALVFSRFHFSNQAFPGLARLQWGHQGNSDLTGIRTVIIGHRGSGVESTKHKFLVGNTTNAIKQAVDAGVDWIEIDIRLSHDGHLVVFHDETIDLKTTGEGAVSELSLDQLQDVEVLVDPTEGILSLDEVFAKFHTHDRKWVLDIKVNGIKDQVLSWVNERLSKEQVILFGTYDVLQQYKDSGYSLGCTAIWKNFGNRMRVLFTPSEIIRRCEIISCDYLVLPVIFANQSLVDAAETRRINVWVYGTDDELDLRYLTGLGIGGFITDRPQRTMKLFANGKVEIPIEADKQ